MSWSCMWFCAHWENIILFRHCFAGFVATYLTADVPIPTQSDPVPLMSVFGWIIIHQHFGYIYDWSRPWSDYKAGFGSIDDNFWLGLEKMHLLTSSQPYRLRVEMQLKNDLRWLSAEYWSFKIGDSPTTNTDWKCLDTAETPVTRCSLEAESRVMDRTLAITITTAWNSRHPTRTTTRTRLEIVHIEVVVGGLTSATGRV